MPMLRLPRPITCAKSLQSAMPLESMRQFERVLGRRPFRTYVMGVTAAHVAHVVIESCGFAPKFAIAFVTSAGTATSFALAGGAAPQIITAIARRGGAQVRIRMPFTLARVIRLLQIRRSAHTSGAQVAVGDREHDRFAFIDLNTRYGVLTRDGYFFG